MPGGNRAVTAAPDVRKALVAARLARASLRRLVALLSKAHRVGKADYWDLFGVIPGLDAMKFFHLFRARREARRSRRLLSRLEDALGDFRLDSDLAARVELPPGVVLADLFEDFLGDLLTQARIEKSRRQANIAISRLGRTIRALEALRPDEVPQAGPATTE